MATDVQTILKLQVPVLVHVGRRTVPLDDILALGPGAIFELQKSSDDDLDLLVNNKPIGKGVAVKVGENFGIRVTDIVTRRERAQALAGDKAE